MALGDRAGLCRSLLPDSLSLDPGPMCFGNPVATDDWDMSVT